MRKITKMNEAAWLLGVIFCSLGVVLCTKSGFGLSMIAAVPYIIHIKMINIFPWYTQGTSEYIWQGFLLIIMCLAIRKFKWKYLLSFTTAVIFGLAVDLWLKIFGGGGVYDAMPTRIISFAIGESVTALSIAFFFRRGMPLQMYELVVVEIADAYKLDKNKVKFANDAVMLVLSIVLALTLNRSFKGLGIGTVIITVLNAYLIKIFGNALDKMFVFDKLM